MGNVLMLFWYCYDDLLAESFGVQSLGILDIKVWFALWFVSVLGDVSFGMLQELIAQARYAFRRRFSQERYS